MNIKIKLILAIASFSVMLAAYGASSTVSPPVTQQDMREIDRFGRELFTPGCVFDDTKDLKGRKDAFYVEISRLHPGQVMYSVLNTGEKIAEALDKNYATRNNNGSYNLHHDNQRALYPIKKAFPVLNTPWGLILLDGHHRAMASIAMGATTLPVTIYDDVTDSGIDELRGIIATRTHPVDATGNRVQIPCHLSQLADDPNRYFVKISAYEGRDSRTKYPLWIPVEDESEDEDPQELSSQEFAIAVLLNKQGWVYKNSYGDSIPENFLNYARVLLTHYKHEIPENCVIENKTFYKDVDKQLLCVGK